MTGGPRMWLRLEAGTLLAGSVIAYTTTHRSWWLVALVLLLADLAAVGHLSSTRLGAIAYNAAHSTPIPAAVIAFGWWQDKPLVLAIGLIWLAHIGFDRTLGYGLKCDDHSQHTHLGRMG